MLRRIVSHFPLKTLSSKRVYCFSDEKDSKMERTPKHRSFVSQTELEKLMLGRIYSLIKASMEKEGSKGKFKFFDRLLSNFKPSNRRGSKDDPSADKGFFADNVPFTMSRNFISFNQILMFLLVGYLFFYNNKNDSSNPGGDGLKRIVSQTEMISLLETGKYSPDLIIIREVVSSDSSVKRIYQTVCLAKLSHKAEVPVGCIITNLSQFLEKVEAINFPFTINFHYIPEELTGMDIKFDFGKLLFFGLIAYIIWKVRAGMKGGAGGGIGDMLNLKKYEPIKPENIQTVFKDVAGMHEAKREITEFVDFLKVPDKYIEMGAKVPKGALLTGPPGTGKTLLARACAGEAGVPFFYVSGSEFVEKYVGMGANRVRSLFESAAKAAPSIIFIDEIDAIGKKRSSGPFANEEKENTLNQLLVNMDGFDTKHKVIVIAATNLKDSLDPALLRPGRFDRAIEINLPNFEERSEILQVHLQKIKFSSEYTAEELAKKISVLTPGFSGAELANICNEAAILGARVNQESVELPQFEKATERVMAGLEKRNLFSDEEKECLAYYECGKAVASWFTEGADPIIKISIAPFSKQSRGYSHEIKDEMPLKTQTELLNRAICSLAGRTSEQHFKGYITSNSDSDMKKTKRILSFMVAKLGMSPAIGRIGFPDTEYMRKPYSEQTESIIDQQISKLFSECQEKAKSIIVERAEMIEKLKELVVQKQTLNHASIKQILGERPFEDNENYQKFLRDSVESKKPEEEEEVTLTPSTP